MSHSLYDIYVIAVVKGLTKKIFLEEVIYIVINSTFHEQKGPTPPSVQPEFESLLKGPCLGPVD